MARLELIHYVQHRPEARDGAICWVRTSREPIDGLPQITWNDGTPWGEANAWALEQLISCRRHQKTVASSMSHLLAYAKWLELEEISWWHFPQRESERCLTRYRGALVAARDTAQLAPRTASHRMSVVVRFYKWLKSNQILSVDWPTWNERSVGLRVTDTFGFEHTMRVASTDLAIPCRQIIGALRLEDGLLPVSRATTRAIIALADSMASEEFALMLRIGFFTGLRIGSIADLKVSTLENATPDPATGWYRIAVGPGARPPVATKFGVSGMVPIPMDLLERLRQYAASTRRLKRQMKAVDSNRALLFLTRFGNSYGGINSRAINVEMMRLRNGGKNSGLAAIRDFHFHRTRATFATELMRACLNFLPLSDAIQMVREACLHRDEATTLKYVKFVETTSAMADAADAFATAFLGLAHGADAN